jgi:PAS domain S-box-containing protein
MSWLKDEGTVDSQPPGLAPDDLRPSDGAMRLLLESVTDYAIYLLDPHGCVVTWNVGAERSNGYRHEEVLGKNFSMFFVPEAVAAGLPAKELAAASRDGRFEIQDWRQRKGGARFGHWPALPPSAAPPANCWALPRLRAT